MRPPACQEDAAADVAYNRAAGQALVALAGAGVQPHVYRTPPGADEFQYIEFSPKRFRVLRFQVCDPLRDCPEAFQLSGVNRALWAAYRHRAWSPAVHGDWPPAFRHAARAFLQAAHRDARSGAGANGMGSLPHELLLAVLGAAAMPLWEWA